MRKRTWWALFANLLIGAASARADPAEFALGAELVRSISHSSHQLPAFLHASLPDAATWGIGVIGEARLSQGAAQLAIWGEVQTDIDVPFYLPPRDQGSGHFTVDSFLPIEIGLRPGLRVGIFEPHLGFIWTILTDHGVIYGLGGNLGADFRIGILLLGFDFRATGLLGLGPPDSFYLWGDPSSLYQGVLSARLVL